MRTNWKREQRILSEYAHKDVYGYLCDLEIQTTGDARAEVYRLMNEADRSGTKFWLDLD